MFSEAIAIGGTSYTEGDSTVRGGNAPAEATANGTGTAQTQPSLSPRLRTTPTSPFRRAALRRFRWRRASAK